MRFAIISDIHEDVENLQKAIDGIVSSDVDEIVCLGDIVGFEKNYYKYDETRSAKKCLEILNQHSATLIPGNHDLNATNRLPFFNRKIGFPDDWYTIPLKDKIHQYEHLFFLYQHEESNDLKEEEIRQINHLNSWEAFKTESFNIIFSHFIYPDINGNLKQFNHNKKVLQKHLNWVKEMGARFSFVGHTHLDGIGLTKKGRLKFEKFGLYSLSAEPQIIFCPAIAKGNSTSGYVLFDTDDLSLNVVKI